MQGLSLDIKVKKTQQRIKEWIDHFGKDGVYISFSGGKDSTVLLDIARKMYPNLKAVFVDTGLEYPEIRDFVKTFSNVDWIRPKMTFKKVLEKYGYPFISKEVSNKVAGGRRYLESVRGGGRIVYAYYMADLLGIDRRENKKNPEYLALKNGVLPPPMARISFVNVLEF